jgi:hypothetical protein
MMGSALEIARDIREGKATAAAHSLAVAGVAQVRPAHVSVSF